MKTLIIILAMLESLNFIEAGQAYEEPEAVYSEAVDTVTWSGWDGARLAPGIGTVYGPTGKETYYNQDMTTLISWARDAGYDAENYPYWLRADGCKMLGPYIMCAANLDHFPRYSTVPSSLGMCIVVDTGEFAYMAEGWSQLDIAVSWPYIPYEDIYY